MKVAILFSGGKDSVYALDYAKEQGWQIEYLLSVKPSRNDCYLFHYASVENTKKIAELLNLRHILISCNVADATKEALIIKQVVEKNPVDVLLLGGTGLQEQQIKSLQVALKSLNVNVFATHAGKDHAEVMQEMFSKGYKFMITQIASDGMNPWLGQVISKENFPKLLRDSEKFGFHVGFEGGYADTFVLESPFFKVQPKNLQKHIESQYNGHVTFEI